MYWWSKLFSGYVALGYIAKNFSVIAIYIANHSEHGTLRVLLLVMLQHTQYFESY